MEEDGYTVQPISQQQATTTMLSCNNAVPAYSAIDTVVTVKAWRLFVPATATRPLLLLLLLMLMIKY
jgi:hypothetical protein